MRAWVDYVHRALHASGKGVRIVCGAVGNTKSSSWGLNRMSLKFSALVLPGCHDENRILCRICGECLCVRAFCERLRYGACGRFHRKKTGDHRWAAVHNGVLPGLRSVADLWFCSGMQVRVTMLLPVLMLYLCLFVFLSFSFFCCSWCFSFYFSVWKHGLSWAKRPHCVTCAQRFSLVLAFDIVDHLSLPRSSARTRGAIPSLFDTLLSAPYPRATCGSPLLSPW